MPTTLAILGGGQLGRMLALAAAPLGVRCRFLDTDPAACAADVGRLTLAPDFQPGPHLAPFLDGVDALTYEFENVPVALAEHAQHALAPRGVAVHPAPLALRIAQDRLEERKAFLALGIAVPPSAPVDSPDAAAEAFRALAPRAPHGCILKTRRLGYDGKGQARVRTADDAVAAFHTLGRAPCLLDAVIPFDRELSILAVRSAAGDVRFYPLCQNTHEGGILRTTIAPAPGVPPHIEQQAQHAARALLTHLGYVGVLALEFFLSGDTLLANEFAPRVHNSGHWTIDADHAGSFASQFENHARAVLGLPLGGTTPRGAHAMLNLIGALPTPAQLRALLDIPGLHPHLYGKQPKPGRKVGHLNLHADTPDALAWRLAAARRILASA